MKRSARHLLLLGFGSACTVLIASCRTQPDIAPFRNGSYRNDYNVSATCAALTRVAAASEGAQTTAAQRQDALYVQAVTQSKAQAAGERIGLGHTDVERDIDARAKIGADSLANAPPNQQQQERGRLGRLVIECALVSIAHEHGAD